MGLDGNKFFKNISRYSVIGCVSCATAVHFSKGNTPVRRSRALIMNSALARFQPTMVHSPRHVRPRRPSCLPSVINILLSFASQLTSPVNNEITIGTWKEPLTTGLYLRV